MQIIMLMSLPKKNLPQRRNSTRFEDSSGDLLTSQTEPSAPWPVSPLQRHALSIDPRSALRSGGGNPPSLPSSSSCHCHSLTMTKLVDWRTVFWEATQEVRLNQLTREASQAPRPIFSLRRKGGPMGGGGGGETPGPGQALANRAYREQGDARPWCSH